LEGKFICKEFLIVEQGLKKSADIQGGRVFWGSSLEKFHCISVTFFIPIERSLKNTHNMKMK
jgi:hypothetical protein